MFEYEKISQPAGRKTQLQEEEWQSSILHDPFWCERFFLGQVGLTPTVVAALYRQFGEQAHGPIAQYQAGKRGKQIVAPPQKKPQPKQNSRRKAIKKLTPVVPQTAAAASPSWIDRELAALRAELERRKNPLSLVPADVMLIGKLDRELEMEILQLERQAVEWQRELSERQKRAPELAAQKAESQANLVELKYELATVEAELARQADAYDLATNPARKAEYDKKYAGSGIGILEASNQDATQAGWQNNELLGQERTLLAKIDWEERNLAYLNGHAPAPGRKPGRMKKPSEELDLAALSGVKLGMADLTRLAGWISKQTGPGAIFDSVNNAVHDAAVWITGKDIPKLEPIGVSMPLGIAADGLEISAAVDQYQATESSRRFGESDLGQRIMQKGARVIVLAVPMAITGTAGATVGSTLAGGSRIAGVAGQSLALGEFGWGTSDGKATMQRWRISASYAAIGALAGIPKVGSVAAVGGVEADTLIATGDVPGALVKFAAGDTVGAARYLYQTADKRELIANGIVGVVVAGVGESIKAQGGPAKSSALGLSRQAQASSRVQSPQPRPVGPASPSPELVGDQATGPIIEMTQVGQTADGLPIYEPATSAGPAHTALTIRPPTTPTSAPEAASLPALRPAPVEIAGAGELMVGFLKSQGASLSRARAQLAQSNDSAAAAGLAEALEAGGANGGMNYLSQNNIPLSDLSTNGPLGQMLAKIVDAGQSKTPLAQPAIKGPVGVPKHLSAPASSTTQANTADIIRPFGLDPRRVSVATQSPAPIDLPHVNAPSMAPLVSAELPSGVLEFRPRQPVQEDLEPPPAPAQTGVAGNVKPMVNAVSPAADGTVPVPLPTGPLASNHNEDLEKDDGWELKSETKVDPREKPEDLKKFRKVQEWARSAKQKRNVRAATTFDENLAVIENLYGVRPSFDDIRSAMAEYGVLHKVDGNSVLIDVILPSYNVVLHTRWAVHDKEIILVTFAPFDQTRSAYVTRKWVEAGMFDSGGAIGPATLSPKDVVEGVRETIAWSEQHKRISALFSYKARTSLGEVAPGVSQEEILRAIATNGDEPSLKLQAEGDSYYVVYRVELPQIPDYLVRVGLVYAPYLRHQGMIIVDVKIGGWIDSMPSVKTEPHSDSSPRVTATPSPGESSLGNRLQISGMARDEKKPTGAAVAQPPTTVSALDEATQWQLFNDEVLPTLVHETVPAIMPADGRPLGLVVRQGGTAAQKLGADFSALRNAMPGARKIDHAAVLEAIADAMIESDVNAFDVKIEKASGFNFVAEIVVPMFGQVLAASRWLCDFSGVGLVVTLLDVKQLEWSTLNSLRDSFKEKEKAIAFAPYLLPPAGQWDAVSDAIQQLVAKNKFSVADHVFVDRAKISREFADQVYAVNPTDDVRYFTFYALIDGEWTTTLWRWHGYRPESEFRAELVAVRATPVAVLDDLGIQHRVETPAPNANGAKRNAATITSAEAANRQLYRATIEPAIKNGNFSIGSSESVFAKELGAIDIQAAIQHAVRSEEIFDIAHQISVLHTIGSVAFRVVWFWAEANNRVEIVRAQVVPSNVSDERNVIPSEHADAVAPAIIEELFEALKQNKVLGSDSVLPLKEIRTYVQPRQKLVHVTGRPLAEDTTSFLINLVFGDFWFGYYRASFLRSAAGTFELVKVMENENERSMAAADAALVNVAVNASEAVEDKYRHLAFWSGADLPVAVEGARDRMERAGMKMQAIVAAMADNTKHEWRTGQRVGDDYFASARVEIEQKVYAVVWGLPGKAELSPILLGFTLLKDTRLFVSAAEAESIDSVTDDAHDLVVKLNARLAAGDQFSISTEAEQSMAGQFLLSADVLRLVAEVAKDAKAGRINVENLGGTTRLFISHRKQVAITRLAWSFSVGAKGITELTLRGVDVDYRQNRSELTSWEKTFRADVDGLADMVRQADHLQSFFRVANATLRIDHLEELLGLPAAKVRTNVVARDTDEDGYRRYGLEIGGVVQGKPIWVRLLIDWYGSTRKYTVAVADLQTGNKVLPERLPAKNNVLTPQPQSSHKKHEDVAATALSEKNRAAAIRLHDIAVSNARPFEAGEVARSQLAENQIQLSQIREVLGDKTRFASVAINDGDKDAATVVFIFNENYYRAEFGFPSSSGPSRSLMLLGLERLLGESQKAAIDLLAPQRLKSDSFTAHEAVILMRHLIERNGDFLITKLAKNDIDQHRLTKEVILAQLNAPSLLTGSANSAIRLEQSAGGIHVKIEFADPHLVTTLQWNIPYVRQASLLTVQLTKVSVKAAIPQSKRQEGELTTLPLVEAEKIKKKLHYLLINPGASRVEKPYTVERTAEVIALLGQPKEELFLQLEEKPTHPLGDRFFIFAVGGAVAKKVIFSNWQIRWLDEPGTYEVKLLTLSSGYSHVETKQLPIHLRTQIPNHTVEDLIAAMRSDRERGRFEIHEADVIPILKKHGLTIEDIFAALSPKGIARNYPLFTSDLVIEKAGRRFSVRASWRHDNGLPLEMARTTLRKVEVVQIENIAPSSTSNGTSGPAAVSSGPRQLFLAPAVFAPIAANLALVRVPSTNLGGAPGSVDSAGTPERKIDDKADRKNVEGAQVGKNLSLLADQAKSQGTDAPAAAHNIAGLDNPLAYLRERMGEAQMAVDLNAVKLSRAEVLAGVQAESAQAIHAFVARGFGTVRANVRITVPQIGTFSTQWEWSTGKPVTLIWIELSGGKSEGVLPSAEAMLAWAQTQCSPKNRATRTVISRVIKLGEQIGITADQLFDAIAAPTCSAGAVFTRPNRPDLVLVNLYPDVIGKGQFAVTMARSTYGNPDHNPAIVWSIGQVGVDTLVTDENDRGHLVTEVQIALRSGRFVLDPRAESALNQSPKLDWEQLQMRLLAAPLDDFIVVEDGGRVTVNLRLTKGTEWMAINVETTRRPPQADPPLVTVKTVERNDLALLKVEDEAGERERLLHELRSITELTYTGSKYTQAHVRAHMDSIGIVFEEIRRFTIDRVQKSSKVTRSADGKVYVDLEIPLEKFATGRQGTVGVRWSLPHKEETLHLVWVSVNETTSREIVVDEVEKANLMEALVGAIKKGVSTRATGSRAQVQFMTDVFKPGDRLSGWSIEKLAQLILDEQFVLLQVNKSNEGVAFDVALRISGENNRNWFEYTKWVLAKDGQVRLAKIFKATEAQKQTVRKSWPESGPGFDKTDKKEHTLDAAPKLNQDAIERTWLPQITQLNLFGDSHISQKLGKIRGEHKTENSFRLGRPQIAAAANKRTEAIQIPDPKLERFVITGEFTNASVTWRLVTTWQIVRQTGKARLEIVDIEISKVEESAEPAPTDVPK